MATVPLSGTNIRLLSGIPFNNDYKNTRWFNTRLEQTTWFQSRDVIHSESQFNFQRIEGRHYMRVGKNIDQLWGVNYLMFQNAEYNNKWFYAFVTKLEYNNPSNTFVYFEIDVLQTWCFDMNFKPSYIMREHMTLWNSDGSPVINTIDEGLNYGTEYDNHLTTRIRTQLNGGYKWLVIVTKTPIESGAENEVEAKLIGNPQPLTYYILPFKDNDMTPSVIIEGDDYPITPPTRLLSEIYKDEQAVNNVVSLYVTDYTGIKTDFQSGSGAPDSITFPRIQSGGNADVESVSLGGETAGLRVVKVKEVHRFHVEEIEISDDKYEIFKLDSDLKESKLLMSPYSMLIFDDFRGNRTEYKLEHIKSKGLTIQVKGSLGLSNNVSYGIKDYNNEDETYDVERADETALISNSPNDLPIINDMLSAFLQGNRNSIQNQKNSIVWNGVMGALGSSVGAGSSAMSNNPIGMASSSINMAQGIGNSVLQMQGIQAKQDDINNIPPQITKQGSNVAYDFGNNYQGIYVLRKQIKPEYKRILQDFFNMFGYKSNRVKVPNFRTRQNWNYVQTISANILGDFNNEDLQILKNIFDNGITLWHTDDIGNYNLENGVR